MATLHQYFETEFSHAVRQSIKIPGFDAVEGSIVYDFGAAVTYLCLYISAADWPLTEFYRLIEKTASGATVHSVGRIQLPNGEMFRGAELRIDNENGTAAIAVRYFGEEAWTSMTDLAGSGRILIFTETDLSEEEKKSIRQFAEKHKTKIQFKTRGYANRLTEMEKPLAFISHDSRDKEVARAIAIGLQRMMCPVWYDEFSLNVGDHLRESIESGLKSCKKCVLILSENFFCNTGWSKREFESIFTREILEGKKLILPIWLNVSENKVFEYSPSLLNVLAINWNVGEQEVVRKLHRAISPSISPEK